MAGNPLRVWVLCKNGEILRTVRGPNYRPRKRSWMFVTEAAAKQQAKNMEGVDVVEFTPYGANDCTICSRERTAWTL